MSTKPDPKKILDEAEDYPVSPEWLEEIRRRCAEIDSGKTTLLDGATVINELRGKYT